jgi:2-desacetyl-2-hydroxyethyl bacteriochlorophyllide A dehydrogenase
MGGDRNMKSQSLWFEGKEKVVIREEDLVDPGPGEVQVQTIASAISSGTELLFYRGELPDGVAVDTTLEGYPPVLSYPIRYGYACAGLILRAGRGVDSRLEGRLVFAFAPHASSFVAAADRVVPAPEGIAAEDAAFLATMETAVTLVLDGAPRLGDRVSIFGVGMVGLATTALLARFPLSRLSAYDLFALRRNAAASLGALAADPRLEPPARMTEDIVFELSGSPGTLGSAISACAYSGLVVVGSWYGAAPPPGGEAAGDRAPMDSLAVNTAFHRNRIRLVTSQVSTIDPSLSGRWSRQRRFEVAWEAIRAVVPSRWVTHRIPLVRAAEAYALLLRSPQETIQILLTY